MMKLKRILRLCVVNSHEMWTQNMDDCLRNGNYLRKRNNKKKSGEKKNERVRWLAR